MHLDPFYITVLPRLSTTGSITQVEGILEVTSIDVGYRHFAVSGGISYRATLSNTGEAVLFTGTASTVLDITCDRCLEPAKLSLTGEIQAYYLFDPETTEGSEDAESYERVDTKGRVDIAPPLLASIVVELPAQVLCRPDCEGMPVALLRDEEGSVEEGSVYTQETTAAQNPALPFAALKDFLSKE